METTSSKRDNLTSKKKLSKSRPKIGNGDRSRLIDISNDSLIVGLARVSLETPISKQESKRCKRISNSGENLLRDQVKNLLQSSTPLSSYLKTQVVYGIFSGKEEELERDEITRTLFRDFSKKPKSASVIEDYGEEEEEEANFAF